MLGKRNEGPVVLEGRLTPTLQQSISRNLVYVAFSAMSSVKHAVGKKQPCTT